MYILYLIHLSSGRPRQRAWRRNWTIVTTGVTEKEAGARAVLKVATSVSPDHKVRVEDVEAICRTPDILIRGALT